MIFSLDDGLLTISADNNMHEVKEIFDHFRIDTVENINSLASGFYVHIAGSKKRPYYPQSASVPFDFLKPYYDLLERITGYAGEAFEIESPLLRYCRGGKWGSLCHTHIVTRAFIDANGYHAEGYQAAEDWNGRTGEENAKRYFADYLREPLGFRKQEPEFIRAGNNHLIPNPNYMKRWPVTPKADNATVFELIFNHWLLAHATPGQINLYTNGDKCHRSVCKTETLAASFIRNYSSSFHIDNYTGNVKFEDFQKA